MPALMLLGYDMDLVRVMLVAVLGGLLGILMMIPLRRAFIVKQHGALTYPEGTACAKVLIVGEQGGSSAKTVFAGFGLAFVYQFLMQALKLWQGVAEPITGDQGLQEGGRLAARRPRPCWASATSSAPGSSSRDGRRAGSWPPWCSSPAIAFFGAGAARPISPRARS